MFIWPTWASLGIPGHSQPEPAVSAATIPGSLAGKLPASRSRGLKLGQLGSLYHRGIVVSD